MAQKVQMLDGISPYLAPEANGMQEVRVYDRKKCARYGFITTPKKADEFVAKRHKSLKKSNMITGLIGVGLAALAGFGGYKLSARVVQNVFDRGMMAFLSAVISTIPSMIISEILWNKTDNKVTQEFIRENQNTKIENPDVTKVPSPETSNSKANSSFTPGRTNNGAGQTLSPLLQQRLKQGKY